MRDISSFPVAEVRRLIGEAHGRRLSELIDAYGDDSRPGVASAVLAAKKRLAASRAEAARLTALYRFEDGLRKGGMVAVAGIDEVGRGALAGPLSAGACILPANPRILGLDDSKRLSPARRAEVACRIREVAVSWSVAHVAASEVDSLGVTNALRRAMSQALQALSTTPDHVVVDGLPIGISSVESAVVGGDRLVAAIAAASVLAKVERDALMVTHAREYPEYGFEINKGYGTPEHLSALSTAGRCAIHRTSFCPGGGTETLF